MQLVDRLTQRGALAFGEQPAKSGVDVLLPGGDLDDAFQGVDGQRDGLAIVPGLLGGQGLGPVAPGGGILPGE